ncbi:MAG TPA: DUF2914 domain-containing protein [Candidatus Paceibacterota bacterium]
MNFIESIFEPIRKWYGRFERPISSLSLILGFIFDAVTLKRVDTLWENVWILGHLVIVAVFIVLIHTTESKAGDEADPTKKHFWYVNILQFFFGGTLSVYLVFYFRSADILVTWPFIFILAGAFWANESLKRHYVRLSFQISLLFLSIYSFAIFLVPVVMHQIGPKVFLLSGFISIVLISLFLVILFYFTKDKFTESKRIILVSISSILVIVNFLYFTNLIPPIPLSLKDAGVYHSVFKNSAGNYEVTYEDHSWRDYFTLYPNFTQVVGTPIYAFSAIFSPSGLNIVVIHEWQHYDETEKDWITQSEIYLSVVGGRDGGFRTYSKRDNLAPGKWRVKIKTKDDHIVGNLRFSIIDSDTEAVLSTEIK